MSISRCRLRTRTFIAKVESWLLLIAGEWSYQIALKPTVIAQSSKESEFITLSLCLKEVLWMKKFSSAFKKVPPEPDVDKILNISIGDDNLVCINDDQDPTISELSNMSM